MSAKVARKNLFSFSRKKLVATGAVLVGSGGVGGFLYYRNVLLPLRYQQAVRSQALAPVRRTPLYVAGASNSVVPLRNEISMPKIVFYVYVGYRMALLGFRSIPVIWYAFLTYALGLCSEAIFFDKVVYMLSSMGPSYIKLGQWMATRPDVFPPQLCSVLEHLYDHNAPHSWAHTERLLTLKYEDGPHKGKCALSFVSDVEKKPLNSGSIAQIHRAKLRNDCEGLPAGTELAIKVTHPYIHEEVAGDLAAMKVFVTVANTLIPKMRYLNLDRGFQEFTSLISSQLNLLIECDNLQQFTYNFRDFNGVIFPTTVPFLSTKDVLFETYEEGEPLQNAECSTANNDVAELGCHMFLKMLFEDNFVHSDLHPGNLLLRTNHLGHKREFYYNGKQKLERELIVLDAGLVTTLSKEERNNFISLFAAVACGDGNLGANLMMDRLPESAQKKITPANRERFRSAMKEIFDTVAPGTHGFTLSKIRIGKVLGKIMSTVSENHIPLDGNFASLVLTVMIGEGLGRKLTPNFNIFAESAPYLISFLQQGELSFVANKLRDTFGASGLLRDSVNLVRPGQTATYIGVGFKKVAQIFHDLVTPVKTQATES